MHYYQIMIQFAKAEAPSFYAITNLIHSAVEVYNGKSLIAANPKQIVGCNIKDELTLEIILESTQELKEAMASKALRVFSSYLISDDVEGNLSPYITGKRLFKMISTKLTNYKKTSALAAKTDSLNVQKDDSRQEIMNLLDGIELIHSITELLMETNDNMAYSKLLAIRKILMSENLELFNRIIEEASEWENH